MEKHTSSFRSCLSTAIYVIARAWLWGDLIFRIYLAEWNRAKISLLSKQLESERFETLAAPTIACLVGYREDRELFEKCLRSYLEASCRYLVVGIDGNGVEDEQMVDVFKKVYSGNRTNIVLRLDSCVGQAFIEGSNSDVSAVDPQTQQGEEFRDTPQFTKAYKFMSMELQNTGFVQKIKESGDDFTDFAICFTQPHRDLKEIRLAAWVLSIVLADLIGSEYLWSSDSDTIVLPDTIQNLSRILSTETDAGGASALVQLNNGQVSLISQIAETAFICDAYLNRAALGALGRSECLNGPGSIFRIAALRRVVASWYCCQYAGSLYRTVINEDMQVTMLLAKNGWRRLYSDQSVIRTAGPTTFKGWVGQRIRWSRGIHLHRMHDYKYIIDQGALYTAYMVRTALYDPLIFLWTAYFAFTGKALINISPLDVMALEVIPACYNYFNSPRPQTIFVPTIILYLLYRAIAPGYRVYTFLTPLRDSWSLQSAHSSPFTLELAFINVWLFVLVSACGRFLIWGFLFGK